MGLTKSRMESPTKPKTIIRTSLWCLDRCRHHKLQQESQGQDLMGASDFCMNFRYDIPRAAIFDSSEDFFMDIRAQSFQTIPSENLVEDTVTLHTDPRIPNEETIPKYFSDRTNSNEETKPKVISVPRNPSEETMPKELSVPRNPSEDTMPKELSDSSNAIEETEPKMFSDSYIPGRMGPEGKSNPSSFNPSTQISINCTASQETEEDIVPKEVGSSCEDVNKKI